MGRLARDEFGNFAKGLGGRIHADGVGRVADVGGGFASDGDVVGRIDAGSQLDLTGQHDVGAVFPSLHERLHGDLGLGVERQASVNDGVGDGVAQFVGVTGRNRL